MATCPDLRERGREENASVLVPVPVPLLLVLVLLVPAVGVNSCCSGGVTAAAALIPSVGRANSQEPPRRGVPNVRHEHRQNTRNSDNGRRERTVGWNE